MFHFPNPQNGFIVELIRRIGNLLWTNQLYEEEMVMGNTLDEMKKLEAENQKLREDNEMLLNIVVQMKVTLNRLVNRYVTDQN